MKIKLPQEPELGTKRAITKFLWFPKMDGGEVHWLQWATWTEKFGRYGSEFEFDDFWVFECWED